MALRDRRLRAAARRRALLLLRVRPPRRAQEIARGAQAVDEGGAMTTLPCVVVEIRCPAGHVHRRQLTPQALERWRIRRRCPECRRAVASVERLGSALAETSWTSVVPDDYAATGRMRACAANGRGVARQTPRAAR
jgi:hypothetical protein